MSNQPPSFPEIKKITATQLAEYSSSKSITLIWSKLEWRAFSSILVEYWNEKQKNLNTNCVSERTTTLDLQRMFKTTHYLETRSVFISSHFIVQIHIFFLRIIWTNTRQSTCLHLGCTWLKITWTSVKRIVWTNFRM